MSRYFGRKAFGSFALASVLALGSAMPVMAEEVLARVALSGGLDRIDPSKSANGTDLAVMMQIYETLLKIDPETGALQPLLAETWEAASPTVWKIKLRDGVKFHDGSPLTAEDVKFSIDRILDPATNSPHFSQITTIKEVRVIDPLTVEIETSQPDPVLMRRMQPVGGSGRVYIVSKAYVEAKGDDAMFESPMGSGPYKFENWVKGTSLTMVRNEDYWGPKPDVTKAVYSFIPENSTRVNALLQGEVDLIQRLPIPDVERVKASGTAEVFVSENGLVHTLLLDSSKAPFNDINMRKAFAHALDTEEFVDALLGEYGRALAQPMAPSVMQYNPDIKPYAYDPELSKSLIGDKAPIKLETFTSDGRYVNDRDFYQVINSALAEVGFETNSRVLEWGRLINMMQNRSAGPFYIIGWDMTEGDASKINTFLHSSSALSVTQDAEYDRLAALAGSETDEAKRTAIWHDIQTYIHDQYFAAAAWQASSIFGVNKRFTYEANFGDNLILTELSLRQK